MGAQETGVLIAIIALSTIFGIMGGAIGTYMSIKNTNGPQEKSFMIKASIVTWIVVILFIALQFVLPDPYQNITWVFYGVALPASIFLMNKKLATLREADKNT